MTNYYFEDYPSFGCSKNYGSATHVTWTVALNNFLSRLILISCTFRVCSSHLFLFFDVKESTMILIQNPYDVLKLYVQFHPTGYVGLVSYDTVPLWLLKVGSIFEGTLRLLCTVCCYCAQSNCVCSS